MLVTYFAQVNRLCEVPCIISCGFVSFFSVHYFSVKVEKCVKSFVS